MALVILAHPHFDQSIANKAIIEELSCSDIDFEIRNFDQIKSVIKTIFFFKNPENKRK